MIGWGTNLMKFDTNWWSTTLWMKCRWNLMKVTFFHILKRPRQESSNLSMILVARGQDFFWGEYLLLPPSFWLSMLILKIILRTWCMSSIVFFSFHELPPYRPSWLMVMFKWEHLNFKLHIWSVCRWNHHHLHKPSWTHLQHENKELGPFHSMYYLLHWFPLLEGSVFPC